MQILDIIHSVLVDVPGCTEPDAVNAYRSALIEFCAKTKAMNAWVTVTTAEMQAPTISADEQVIEILQAKLAGKDIDVVQMNSPRLDDATADDPVLSYQNVNAPILTPMPATVTDVDLLFVFGPGPAAETISDEVWLRYADVIKDGAIGRLLMRPKKTYTDAALGAYYLQKFKEDMNGAARVIGLNISNQGRRIRVAQAGL